MAFSKFRPLDEESIKATSSLSSEIGHNYDDTSTKEVGDGDLSFSGSFVVKQALAYVRCIGESCSMTNERSDFGATTLKEHGGLWPERVPPPYPIVAGTSLLYRSTIEHQRAGESLVLLLELADTLLNQRRELSICDVVSAVG
ncbi:hypothetical protein V6N13_098292 [Hibiscus sabdariffa]|uniref:Uncharacterized protein n=1 Tax=Hibiscus sabdariffa TaxID=183260 RepID=A0ABR2EDQ9_9ROSI